VTEHFETRSKKGRGLEVRQAIEAKNNGIRPELQRIWAIFDVRRDEWLDVYVDPDKCVSADT